MAAREVPPTTSASQLVAYAMCPRKYYLSYCTDTEPEFVSTNLVLGSAVHSAIGWYFEERLAGRSHNPDVALDVFTADLLSAVCEKPVRWKDSSADDLDEEGRRLVRTYLTTNAMLPVMAVEEKFEVPLVDPSTGEVLGRPIRGYFDFVLDDRIVELKTSARGWSESDLPRHLQVGAYCFASTVLFAAAPTVEVHVAVKLKREPRVERYVVERSGEELGWWLGAAAEIERAIDARIFPPAPGPLCKECEYQKACASMTLADRRVPARAVAPVSLSVAL